MTATADQSEWQKLVSRINRVYKKLEAEVSELQCIELLKHERRARVLEKHMKKLQEEERKLRVEYWKFRRVLDRYEFLAKKIARLGGVLIVIFAITASLTLLEYNYSVLSTALALPPDFSQIFHDPSTLPVLFFSQILVIAFTGVLLAMHMAVVAPKYSKLKQTDIELRRKYYNDVLKRLNVLRRELEASTAKLLSKKTLSLCKCYEEYKLLKNIVENVNVILSSLTRCRTLECVKDSLNALATHMRSLRNTNTVCSDVFTQEYFLKFEFSDDFENILQSVVEKPETASQLKIKISTSIREEHVDLGEVIRSTVKRLMFSTSSAF